jgi:hypothetical protein
MRTYRMHVLVIGLVALAFAGCGGGGGSDGYYTCSYEKRVTDGCDGYGFGEWQADSFSFNSDDYYIEPSEVCANVTTGGEYCEAGCCIDAEFRDVQLTSDIDTTDEWL